MQRIVWLTLGIVALILALVGAVGGRAEAGSVPTGRAPQQGTPTPSATGTPPACGPAWRLVPSVNPGPQTNYLYDISAHTAGDIWTVGNYDNGTSIQTLTEHWDGTVWNWVPSPSPGTSDTELYGVAAVGANDAWAVGVTDGATLIEHWDGSAWTVVTHPNPGTGFDTALWSLAVVAPNDVWTAGNYYNGTTNQTLIEHWNGTVWSIVPSPSPSIYGNFLNGLTAVAANDLWAVGNMGASDGGTETLIEHWDGNAWTVVPSPNPGTFERYLKSVTHVAANDVWAAGFYENANDPASHTMIEHWDGTAWTVVPSPDPGLSNVLLGAAAVAANDIWAVGSYFTGSGSLTLALHWDGSQWSVVPSPNPNVGSGGNFFHAVAALGAGDVWAAGFYSQDTFEGTVIAHYAAGPCPTVTPAVTPTVTASATPTVCPLLFSDVPPGDPFYAYIRCLACRGVLSGYSSSPPCAAGGAPCFNGGAAVTRGQVAKIVANAANYQDVIPSTQQTFRDVPPSNPFWVYIERAALHNVISGYSASPPCPAGQAPCFLAFNNVTRGQMAKIAAQAGGYSEAIPSTQQTFSDVPNSNPFWVYIERTQLHGVISGYSTSPPCPGGVPCFLWANDLTRNQAAKIVAVTFYPNCATPAR